MSLVKSGAFLIAHAISDRRERRQVEKLSFNYGYTANTVSLSAP